MLLSHLLFSFFLCTASSHILLLFSIYKLICERQVILKDQKQLAKSRVPKIYTLEARTTMIPWCGDSVFEPLQIKYARTLGDLWAQLLSFNYSFTFLNVPPCEAIAWPKEFYFILFTLECEKIFQYFLVIYSTSCKGPLSRKRLYQTITTSRKLKVTYRDSKLFHESNVSFSQKVNSNIYLKKPNKNTM